MVGMRWNMNMEPFRAYLRERVNSVDAALNGKRRVQFEIENDVQDPATGHRYYEDVDKGRDAIVPREERITPENPDPRLSFQVSKGKWVHPTYSGPSRPARITERAREIMRERLGAFSKEFGNSLVASKRIPTGADFSQAIERMSGLIVEVMQEATDQSVKHQDTKSWYGHDMPTLRESFKVRAK
jgi:hypothetical protein